MAVEARHPAILLPQILPNREMINSVEGNRNIHLYGGGGVLLPSTAAKGYVSAADDIILPALKSEGVVQKRSRDEETLITNHPFLRPRLHVEYYATNYKDHLFFALPHHHHHHHHHLWEIDSFLSQHTERMRMEMEEKRRNRSRRIMALLQETIRKKLEAKEEEMQKINEVKMALEERVKSLCVENHIWRELARSNEATANALRTNLQQVLLQAHQRHYDHPGGATAPLIHHDDEEAESCCGSNYSGHEELKGGDRWDDKRQGGCNICMNCGKEEASMLLLPCRHLCLCHGCGHLLHHCPLCNSLKNGCVHVLF